MKWSSATTITPITIITTTTGAAAAAAATTTTTTTTNNNNNNNNSNSYFYEDSFPSSVKTVSVKFVTRDTKFHATSMLVIYDINISSYRTSKYVYDLSCIKF